MNIITRKGNKLQLNGNKLSGDTWNEKDYIKSKLGGHSWDKTTKTWTVDVEQVQRWLNTEGAHIRIDDNAPVQAAKPRKWTYEDFLRSADDPNSDY